MTTQPALPAKLAARLRALPEERRQPIVALVELTVSAAERRLALRPKKVRVPQPPPPPWFSARDVLGAADFGTHGGTAKPLDRAEFPDE